MVLPGEALGRQPVEGRPAPVPAIGVVVVPGPADSQFILDSATNRAALRRPRRLQSLRTEAICPFPN